MFLMHCIVIQSIGWRAIETVLIVIDFETVLVVYTLNMYLVHVPCIYVSAYLYYVHSLCTQYIVPATGDPHSVAASLAQSIGSKSYITCIKIQDLFRGSKIFTYKKLSEHQHSHDKKFTLFIARGPALAWGALVRMRSRRPKELINRAVIFPLAGGKWSENGIKLLLDIIKKAS